jgi:hypothetical protein
MSGQTNVTTKGGCGCGGKGGGKAAGGGSCSCGGHAACVEPAAYVRPRFFPGQLLTEDDLGLMVGYAAAKNRLHNRFLFGDGVVCGLRVSCDPCGGGKVTVGSGYALDCCGNDIVVPCNQALDISRMVRELLRARGRECGEPCPDPAAPATPAPDPVPPPAPAPAQPAGGAEVETLGTSREYCLYIRYCEHPTEPVSPYITDDPCAAQACQFSRVEEGYSFELRCSGEEPARADMASVLAECLGPFTKKSALTVLLQALRSRSAAMAEAIAKAPEPDEATFEEDDLAQLQALHKTRGTYPLEEMRQIELMAGLIVKSDLWHASGTSRAARRAGASRVDAPEEYRKEVHDRSAALVKTAPFEELPPGGIERAIISGTLDAAQYWLDPTKRSKANPEKWHRDYPPRLLAGGFAMNATLFERYRGAVADFRGRLLAAAGSRSSDCRLPADLAAVRVPSKAQELYVREEMVQLQGALDRSIRGADRLILDCLCGALLPECAACDDPGVLLACLTVADCKVVDVCNLRRRFVLAPASARYWGGMLFDRLGDQLEGLCCGEREGKSAMTATAARMPELQKVAEVIRAASVRSDLASSFEELSSFRGVLERAVAAPAHATTKLAGRRTSNKSNNGGT